MRERRRCHSSARRSPERRQATESPAGRQRARRPHRAIDDVSTAQDVHDGIIQTIYAVGLNLEYCRLSLRASPDEVDARLGEAIEGLDQAIVDIRAYVLDLTQRVGDPADLRKATEGSP
jgi:signal transduction histidine kinase